MGAADRLLARIEAVFLHISVAGALVIAAILCWGIAARSTPLPGLPDDILIVRQLMVGTIAVALGHATATRGHIAIDLLYRHLPAPMRKACNLLALAVGLIAFGPLCVFALEEAARSYGDGAYMYGKLKLPEWPAEAAFFLGLLVMNLRLILLFLRDARARAPFDGPAEDGPAGEGPAR
ncbi:TRAP transporter small permease [Salipiger sp.]|uniref:TRAP transporter small permease n=1 Tax=Salipiger sp. TaxID=2078585 RepID=UPI003A971C42